ncbi:hypothetical protein [Moorena producens]|nr:hypothetical protein [Moorena producens]
MVSFLKLTIKIKAYLASPQKLIGFLSYSSLFPVPCSLFPMTYYL